MTFNQFDKIKYYKQFKNDKQKKQYRFKDVLDQIIIKYIMKHTDHYVDQKEKETTKKILESNLDSIVKEFYKIIKKGNLDVINNKLVINENILLQLSYIKIFKEVPMLANSFLDFLQKEKIISKYSKRFKLKKQINGNPNHTFFTKSILEYYDQILEKRDQLLQRISVNDSQLDKVFNIYISLFTIKKYDEEILKNIKKNNLYILNDNTVVLIFSTDVTINDNIKSYVRVEFFEKILNDFLINIFFKNESNNLLTYINYIEIDEDELEEYLFDNFNFIVENINQYYPNIKRQIQEIKNVVTSNIKMEQMIHNSSFSVTLLEESNYPKISLLELIYLFPNIEFPDKLISLSIKNVQEQKNTKEYDFDEIETISLNQFIEDDKFKDYEKFLGFKSFKRDKKESYYNDYLKKFTLFKYGYQLGNIILKLEENRALKHFMRVDLLKHINSIFSELLNEKYIISDDLTYDFYTLLDKVGIKNIQYNKNTDIYLNVIYNVLSTKYSYNTQFNVQKRDKVMFDMIDYMEATILSCSVYNRSGYEHRSPSTINNKIHYLFNFCFKFIFQHLIIDEQLEDKIEKEINKNKDKSNYDMITTVVNDFLIRYDIQINKMNIIRRRLATKSLIFKDELNCFLQKLKGDDKYLRKDKYQEITFMLLMYYGGFRESELLITRFKDISIYNNILYIDINTKGILNAHKKLKSLVAKRRVKRVIQSKEHLAIIKRYLSHVEEDKSVYLFPEKSKNGYERKTHQNQSFINNLNQLIKEVIPYRYVSLHSFRHTATTRELKNMIEDKNVSLGSFYNLLIEIGHSEPKITFENYAHLDYILFLKEVDL